MSTNDLQPTQTADRDRVEPAYEAVLIFDRGCPFCSAAASALRRLPKVGVLAWNGDAAQQFFTAQFDEPPFTLVFVDVTADQMWLDRATADESCDRASLPTFVQDLLEDDFERIADTVRVAVGSTQYAADLSGTRSLNDAATAKYDNFAPNVHSTLGAGELRRSAVRDRYASV
ncbi:DUF393 domain-containing protein [Haloplanus pelagicus]|jgi:hypothetical protein|uniref:DUF393 domain-containing protein n=1 Tax=Haloplanus pelagicus TaxID=2949995 RepID=UPI00203A9512|nr:DUF393 domain-containing protein [Haloplanus sp. HW8-1]